MNERRTAQGKDYLRTISEYGCKTPHTPIDHFHVSTS